MRGTPTLRNLSLSYSKKLTQTVRSMTRINCRVKKIHQRKKNHAKSKRWRKRQASTQLHSHTKVNHGSRKNFAYCKRSSTQDTSTPPTLMSRISMRKTGTLNRIEVLQWTQMMVNLMDRGQMLLQILTRKQPGWKPTPRAPSLTWSFANQ